MQITNVPALKINKLTHEQFKRAIEAGRINDNEMYLTPDNHEPYIIPLHRETETDTLEFASGFEFNTEEAFQEIVTNQRPAFIFLNEGDITYKLFTFVDSDPDEGLFIFQHTYIEFIDFAYVNFVEQINLTSRRISSRKFSSVTDKELKTFGQPADAQITGTRLGKIESDINSSYGLRVGSANIDYGAYICASNGNTMVARTDGGLMTSLDGGYSWILTLSLTDAACDLIYGADKFVYVDDDGDSCYSEDGIDWHSIDLAATNIAYGNGRYVASNNLSQDARIYVSTDGIEWTLGPSTPQGTQVDKIYYLPFANIFMVLDYSGCYAFSDEGITAWSGHSDAGFDASHLSCILNDRIIFAVPYTSASGNSGIKLYSINGSLIEEEVWIAEHMNGAPRCMYYNPELDRVSILWPSGGYWFNASEIDEPAYFYPMTYPEISMTWFSCSCYNDQTGKMVVFGKITEDQNGMCRAFITDGTDLNITSIEYNGKIVTEKIKQSLGIGTSSAPMYTYGEEDLVPGETPLETGKLHFVYV